jgi:hypothetical protein
MPTEPVFIPAVRRRFGKARPPQALPPAPPVLNQITSVAYGGAVEQLTVTVSGDLVALGELEGLMAVVIQGNPYTPIDGNLDDLPIVTLTFERDVTEATTWSVPDPATWEFAEGTLVAPFSGSIE